MNPTGKEKDEMETDSIAKSDSESTPTDQEIERPPTQSGVATSSQPSSQTPSLTTVQRIAATSREGNVPAFTRTQLRTQSGVATSSQPSSKTQIQLQRMTRLQKIADTFGEGNVPAFITTEIQNLSKSLKRKPNSRRPPPSPKKPKLTHPVTNPVTNPGPSPVPNPDPYFEISVSNSDSLPIPYTPAKKFFPATSPDTSEQTIQLTDPSGLLWPNISYVCFDEEKAFVLTHNWAQYAEKFKIGVRDTLRFTPEGQVMNRFLMQHFPRPKSEPVQLRLHQFPLQNFLFQVKLGESDVAGRLMIDAEKVRLHCPGIKGGTKPEMVKLTDSRDKDWYVTMVYSASEDRYTVMDGWSGFVRERGLVAGDLVRFYNPSSPSHEKHFLIHFFTVPWTNLEI